MVVARGVRRDELILGLGGPERLGRLGRNCGRQRRTLTRCRAPSAEYLRHDHRS